MAEGQINPTTLADSDFVRTVRYASDGSSKEFLARVQDVQDVVLADIPIGTDIVTLTGVQTLTNKTLTSPVITTPTGIVKADVGLGNVTNTSDANKPVSTAQQTALDLKANLASPTFTGTVAGITSTMVGLGNVTNTSDANKPVSTAQQTALDLKANLLSPILVTPALGTPSSGNLANCTFPTLNQSTLGSAATLTTSRNIGGTAFNGSADVTPLNTTVANEGTDTTCFPTFVTAATGDLPQRTNTALTYNSNTGNLGSTIFTGAFVGNVTGNVTGTSGSTTGNALTATTLQSARTIGGVSFNGSADIVPQTIQTVNEATDTTCFPLFITTAGSQSLQPLNNAGFIYNSNTNALTATTFVGALTGTASGNYVVGNALGTPSSGTLTNCTFPTLNQNTSGSAATLTTSRSIGGTSFNGSADITPLNTTVANEATDTTCFPTFVTAATGDLPQRTNASLTFNSNTGSLAATTFVGALTGNVSGTATNLSGTPALPNGTTATTQTQADASTKLATTAYTDTGLGTKQATLVSATNIKTINGSSVLGSGDLTVSASDPDLTPTGSRTIVTNKSVIQGSFYAITGSLNLTIQGNSKFRIL